MRGYSSSSQRIQVSAALQAMKAPAHRHHLEGALEATAHRHHPEEATEVVLTVTCNTTRITTGGKTVDFQAVRIQSRWLILCAARRHQGLQDKERQMEGSFRWQAMLLLDQLVQEAPADPTQQPKLAAKQQATPEATAAAALEAKQQATQQAAQQAAQEVKQQATLEVVTRLAARKTWTITWRCSRPPPPTTSSTIAALVKIAALAEIAALMTTITEQLLRSLQAKATAVQGQAIAVQGQAIAVQGLQLQTHKIDLETKLLVSSNARIQSVANDLLQQLAGLSNQRRFDMRSAIFTG